MAGRDLKLQVVFSALDRITAPLKKIMSGSSDTAKALKATSDRLRELNTQQKNIGKFRELHGGLDATRTKLEAAQQKVASLATKMKQVENPTRAMTREFNAAVKAASALKTAGQQQAQQLQVMRERLAGAGIGTKDLANHERNLRREIEATNKTMTQQQQRLANSAAKQQRVANATQHADRLRNKAGNMAAAGAGATAAGAVVGAPIVKGLNEAKHYQTEVGRVKALGLGDKVSAEAVAFARNMKTYGTSQLDNLQLMRDGMSAFADVHHAEMVAPTLAKMKFANHAFFGEEEGADNERKFMDMLKVIELRGGLESKEKFEAQANIVQQVITATGGRVGPNEWLNMIKTGGLAAKGLRDDAFYYQMEPLVQEMSGNRVGTSLMSAYQNLYQGRTTKRSAKKLEEFGLIGDKSKVKHDKAGQVSFLDPGALLGADLFRENQFEWMEKVLLPQLAKKGITEKKQVLDAIGSIFSNRTASNLYSQMYLQRVQIHKNEKLNRGAANIGQLEKLGRDTAAGKELEAQSKLANLKLTMGEKILPMYARGLEMAISAVTRLNGFMEHNPTVAKAMITGFAVLAGLLLVIGPIMLGIAALVGPYAMLHVMFAKMGVTGGVLTPMLRGLGGAFMWAGRAVLWLGRALMLNPIGIAVTVIAGAAFLIYKYWEPIKAFFGGLWSTVKAAFAGGFVGVNRLIADWSPLGLFYRTFAGVLGWFGIDLPARFTDFAAGIRDRFANGMAPLASFFSGLWSQINAASAGGIGSVTALIANWSPLGVFYRAFAGVLGWFGIELPAKFTDYGANVIRGLVNGITSSMGLVKDAISNAGSSTIAWFKEKLGIHSPSRVFAQLGDYTMQGLTIGLARSEGTSLEQVSGLAKRLTQIGASIAIGTAVGPAAALGQQPSVDAPANSRSVRQVGDLFPHMAPGKVVPAPAAQIEVRPLVQVSTVQSPAVPLDARPVVTPAPDSDALRQVNALARQLGQDKAMPTPVAPLDARPPVTPAPNSDVLRQAGALARQMAQDKAVPAPAAPHDARPLLTPAPSSDALRKVSALARQLLQDKAVPAPAAPLDARPPVMPPPNSDVLRQVNALARPLAQDKAVPAPAAMLNVRPPVTPAPSNDALRQATTLARQLVQDKAAPAPAAPLDTRPLVTPAPNNDALRQVNALARQLVQDKAVPTPAALFDARPPVTPAPNSDALRQVSALARKLTQAKAMPAPATMLNVHPPVTPAPDSDVLRQANALARQLVQDKAAPTPAAPLDARPLVTPAPHSDVLRQVSALARQLTQDKAVPAPAAPLDARPLVTSAPSNDALRQASALARQLVQDKAAPTPAAPLDARPPVTPAPHSDVLRQVSALARQLTQEKAVPTPAVPLDARPPATPAPSSDALRQAATLARQLVQANPVPAPAAPLNARPLATPAPNNDALRQVSGLARQLAQLGAGININGGSDTPAIAFDTRPPVTMRGHTATYDSHDTVQIHIAPTPGMDAQAIARAVYAAMEQRDREKAARMRSSLSDRE